MKEKLDQGYLDAPGKDVARIPGRHAFVMKLGKRGPDRLGGLPPGVDDKAWPRCRDCETPMAFVALFHRDEERLPLRHHAALAVFTCNGQYAGATCETFDPDAGCNAVLFLDADALGRQPLTRPPEGPLGPPPVMAPHAIAYERVFEPDVEQEEDEEPVSDDKCGGYPTWYQLEDVPQCPTCTQPLRFVAQLDERDPLNFGGGRSYVFVCAEEHTAKFLWQR